jgi:SAM-dependent methyltransferase
VTAVDGAALAGFGAVDQDAASALLVAALDEQAALPAVQRLRATATELLSPGAGDRLVDVGCGTGDVVRALAALVGPDGLVIGVDPSEVMLAVARARSAGRDLPVEFVRGDVGDLELPDSSADGVVCERVLQHVGDAPGAVAELERITRPGGRVVVIDTDWGLHAIHGADPDLTRRVVDAWVDSAADGRVGRRLPSLLADAGLTDRTVVAETLVSTAPHRPAQPPFTTMATLAERTGALRPGEAATWLGQLEESARHGRFLWALTMFAAAGTRP